MKKTMTPEVKWDFDKNHSDVLINVYSADLSITTSLIMPFETAKKFALELLQNVLTMENTRDV